MHFKIPYATISGAKVGESNMTPDELFMKEAILLSQQAVIHGNEPFGAVLVKDGEIVATSENQIYTKADPTSHAELGLIRRFCSENHVTSLQGYTLYSNCEPCIMCAGAIATAKVSRLVYAASNVELNDINGDLGFETSKVVFANSKTCPQVTSGVLKEEALSILTQYFKNRR